MPALTRSVSATYSNKSYLTPQTPSPIHPRAFVDMTPLPSLFDKIAEASKPRKRSTSLQLESKVDDPFVLPQISEECGNPLSDAPEVCGIQQTSGAPTEVDDEPESKSVVDQPLATSDLMDYEDTPIAFPEPLISAPLASTISPLAPAPASSFVHGEALTTLFPSNQPHIYQYPELSVTQPSSSQEPLLLSELKNPVTSPDQTVCCNPSSSDMDLDSYFPPPSFPQPQVNEQPQQVQVAEQGTASTQYPTPPPLTYQTTLSILSTSAPVQNTIRPVVLPAFSQSFPTGPCPDLRRMLAKTLSDPPTPALAEAYCRPMFAPQAQRRPEFEDIFARFHRRTRLSSWRVREIERQREMDLIAEPYLARLREVSLRKKAEAEARALAGKKKTERDDEERGKSWWDFLREDEKKVRKELTAAERQQRSEERRQTRKNSREKRRHSSSGENALPEGQERGVSVSPRRKSTGRSKPYSIPHPSTRSPRRSHTMPGGFDSDDLRLGRQTSVVSDIDALWKGLVSVVDAGYRLWTQH